MESKTFPLTVSDVSTIYFSFCIKKIQCWQLLNLIFITITESEVLEAIAQYDFSARSSREVSFMKGDLITLYSQASSDWWRGCVGGREGLIPDKYILIKIRGEDDPRDSISSISDQEPRRRISSQSDTLRSSQSPRVSRPSQHSISAPPETPPLVRATPTRQSASTPSRQR